MKQVTLNLHEHVKNGISQILVRINWEDKREVKTAAKLLGLTQSQFIRNVVVMAARQVIAEHEAEKVA